MKKEIKRLLFKIGAKVDTLETEENAGRIQQIRGLIAEILDLLTKL